MEMAHDVFNIHDGVVHQMPIEKMRAKRVTRLRRISEEIVDSQRQSKHDRNRGEDYEPGPDPEEEGDQGLSPIQRR